MFWSLPPQEPLEIHRSQEAWIQTCHRDPSAVVSKIGKERSWCTARGLHAKVPLKGYIGFRVKGPSKTIGKDASEPVPIFGFVAIM